MWFFLLCVPVYVFANSECVCNCPKIPSCPAPPTTHKPTTKHTTKHAVAPTTMKPATMKPTTKLPISAKPTTQAAPKMTTPNAELAVVLKCMCEMASNCKPLACGPNGACGYFQITMPYYQDCGELEKKPGDTPEAALARCAMDYTCSSKCVEAYVKKYKGSCPGVSDNQAFARLHSGGPSGCTNPATMAYWNKVQSCCKCS